MKISNSCSSSKRSVKELVESTCYTPYKTFKTRRYEKVLFFTTTTSIHETWNHKHTCQSIVIASSVETIPEECFTAFSVLDTVIFQKGSLLKVITCGAFQNCQKLTSICLPSKLTSIEKFAFDGCTSLKAVNIPKSVYHIGAFAFSDYKSLTDISKVPFLIFFSDGGMRIFLNLHSSKMHSDQYKILTLVMKYLLVICNH